jgi:hypothetical protein
MKWVGLLLVTGIAWYTFNVARLAWRDGNKAGAFMVGALALLAFVFPTLVLLFKNQGG